MTTTQEALKMAIEALQNNQVYDCEGKPMLAIEEANEKAIQACKEALEQQEQEPVAWTDAAELETINSGDWFGAIWAKGNQNTEDEQIPLYTHPAKQLSDDEIWELINKTDIPADYDSEVIKVVKDAIAKIRGG